MKIKLYNTLSRSKEEFRPLRAGQVSLYTCGPTVYNYYHIGNLRNAVFYDTLKRTLTASGLQVKHIMNITDVGHLSDDADAGDDKLQNQAAEEGKSVWEVADFYLEAFKSDMGQLGVIAPTKYVRATEAIGAQIAMVQTLVDKGFAYQTDQAIYFDVSKLADYGKLTGQKLDDKRVGARQTVVVDPAKRHPQDFALWFFTTGRFAHHQMHWPSPWGEGFPGWHLECSAILEQELGTTIDIHGGGVDHIGTHHTNEIAQSEAAHNGAPLAKYWLHNEFLIAEGRKMSKSLGNTYRLADIETKGFKPAALRLLYLGAHYRSQQNFTWEALEAAQQLLARLWGWSELQFQPVEDDTPELGPKLEATYRQILAAFQDDLATPQALAQLLGLVGWMDPRPIGLNSVADFREFITKIDDLFGLNLASRQDIDKPTKALIAQRWELKQAGKFEQADELRRQFQLKNLEVKDTAFGPRWRRLV